MLHVQVIACRDLLIGDAVSSDPYVIANVLHTRGQTVAQKTKVVEGSLNPEFHEMFMFSSNLLDKTSTLSITVMDKDVMSSDDSLGTKLIPLTNLRIGEPVLGWYELEPCSGFVLLKIEAKAGFPQSGKTSTFENDADKRLAASKAILAEELAKVAAGKATVAPQPEAAKKSNDDDATKRATADTADERKKLDDDKKALDAERAQILAEKQALELEKAKTAEEKQAIQQEKARLEAAKHQDPAQSPKKKAVPNAEDSAAAEAAQIRRLQEENRAATARSDAELAQEKFEQASEHLDTVSKRRARRRYLEDNKTGGRYSKFEDLLEGTFNSKLIAKIVEVYIRNDRDGSNTVSGEELATTIEELHFQTGTEVPTNDSIRVNVKSLMSTYDKDRNHVLSIPEFCDLLKRSDFAAGLKARFRADGVASS